MQPLPVKPAVAMACLAVAMLGLGYVPAFEQLHALRPELLTAIVDFRQGANPAPVEQGIELPRSGRRLVQQGAASVLETRAAPIPRTDSLRAFGHLTDRANALGSFYNLLDRVEAREPGAVATVLHFGDSPITADQITSDLRAILQYRFGDAGHGFVLIAKPWAWYHHHGVDLTGKGWTSEASSQNRAADGLHGLGGVTFHGLPGSTARYRLSTPHDRVEIAYLSQPGGGDVTVFAEGRAVGSVSTDDRVVEPLFGTVALPPSTTDVRLEVSAGAVRLFGVSFEKDGPGVRYHSLGVNGGQVKTLLRYTDGKHLESQIRHYRPNLVVVNFGTNESGSTEYIEGAYAGELRQLIQRIRAAAPVTPVLVMSPMDRGERTARGEIVTVAAMPKLVAIQRRIARETGCAFFNTFQAMGGEGTMARWYQSSPRLVSADFIHPLPGGAHRVGTMVEEALYQGYLAHKRGGMPVHNRAGGSGSE